MNNRKIKILLIQTSPLTYGGVEKYASCLIDAILIHNNKFSVEVLSPYECTNDAYREKLNKLNIPLYELGLNFSVGTGAKKLTRATKEFYKEHNDFDIVHVNSGSKIAMAKLAYISKKMLNAKVLLHSHCSIDNITLSKKILRWIFSFPINKYADYLLACSREASVAQFVNKVQDKVVICNNGVDVEKFLPDNNVRQEYRKRLDINQDDFVIGHIGRFTYQKNQIFLVEVFREIISQHKNSKLLLIGEGEDLESVKKKVKEYKLQNEVIFLKEITDIQNYMQVMDVFVMPSTFEGLPIVAVEAQAAGLPLILSDSISKETKLTKNVTFVSLDNSKSQWAKLILSLKGYEKEDNTINIKNRGFSIPSCYDVVLNLYSNSAC